MLQKVKYSPDLPIHLDILNPQTAHFPFRQPIWKKNPFSWLYHPIFLGANGLQLRATALNKGSGFPLGICPWGPIPLVATQVCLPFFPTSKLINGSTVRLSLPLTMQRIHPASMLCTVVFVCIQELQTRTCKHSPVQSSRLGFLFYLHSSPNLCQIVCSCQALKPLVQALFLWPVVDFGPVFQIMRI